MGHPVALPVGKTRSRKMKTVLWHEFQILNRRGGGGAVKLFYSSSQTTKGR